MSGPTEPKTGTSNALGRAPIGVVWAPFGTVGVYTPTPANSFGTRQRRPSPSPTGGVLARRARAGHLFLDHSPFVCLFLPPPHQTIWGTFSPCLRIRPILCTRFMTMARVVVGSGGGDILCC